MRPTHPRDVSATSASQALKIANTSNTLSASQTIHPQDRAYARPAKPTPMNDYSIKCLMLDA